MKHQITKQEAVGENVLLQKDLIHQLHAYNDVERAATWANRLGLPDEDIPVPVAVHRKHLLEYVTDIVSLFWNDFR